MAPSHSSLPATRRVILLGLAIGGTDAEMIQGINLYRRTAGPWLMSYAGHGPGDLEEALAARPDGILANIVSNERAQRLQSLSIPVVDLSGQADIHPFPLLRVDDAAVGRLAAQHLLSRHFRRFAYFSDPQYPYVSRRWEGFRTEMSSHGHACEWIKPGAAPALRSGNRPAHRSDLSRWLLADSVPAGIFCSRDILAMAVCDICRALSLVVPEQVGILGVDNLACLCESCSPPVSSIAVPGVKIGYEAARLLDALMAGTPSSQPPVLFPPAGVIERQSTEHTSVDDPLVARALSLIRDHATSGMAVGGMVSGLPMTRRSLERRFRRATGKTLLDEVYAVRLAKARSLLLETTLPIKQIAVDCGFRKMEVFCQHFRQATGMTASEFRKSYKI